MKDKYLQDMQNQEKEYQKKIRHNIKVRWAEGIKRGLGKSK